MAGTILTNIGLSKLAAATPQNQLNITHIAVGDGNGGFPTLSPTMTALTNEVWRGDSSNPVKDGSNSSYVYFETNIQPEVGPFDVREIACFDSDGDMIAIGHTSLIQKPNPTGDASFAVAVKIFIALENASDFDLIYQNTEVVSHNSLSGRNDFNAHDSEAISYKQKPAWNESGLPYISIKEKILSQPLDLVGDGRAPNDGTGNASDAFKELLEFGAKRITAPEGIFLFNDPIVIHDKSGFKFTGAGRDNTEIKASSSLLLDTDELSHLPIDFQNEYNKNALFHVTAFDGANGRPNKAARNTQFMDFNVDFEGSPADRVAALMASPQFAHAQYRHITLRNALGLSHFWITSGLDSRFYHLEFNEIETIDCVHHIKNDFKQDGAGITAAGSTWLLLNNTIARNDFGYEMYGVHYSAMLNNSVDNQKKGSYAYDVDKCLGLSIIAPGIETRLNKAGEGYGGGMFRFTSGSSVDISGGFLVGGDRDGEGTGNISDYGVPAMNLIDDSTVNWRCARLDAKIGAGAQDWPIRVGGSGYLNFQQGAGTGVFGDSDSDYETLGAGRVRYETNTGKVKFLSAEGADSKFSLHENIRTEAIDDETLQAEISDDPNDYDVLSLAESFTFKNGVIYRINLGSLGLADYKTINFPTSSGPFGLLEQIEAGGYQKLTVDLNNGEQWKIQRATAGDWSAWVLLGSEDDNIDDVDQEVLQASSGDDPNDYDVLSLAESFTFKNGVIYRINLGSLGLADYKTINFPTSSGPFGLLEQSLAGGYQKLVVDLNNGEQWKIQRASSGAWSGWVQLG